MQLLDCGVPWVLASRACMSLARSLLVSSLTCCWRRTIWLYCRSRSRHTTSGSSAAMKLFTTGLTSARFSLGMLRPPAAFWMCDGSVPGVYVYIGSHQRSSAAIEPKRCPVFDRRRACVLCVSYYSLAFASTFWTFNESI